MGPLDLRLIFKCRDHPSLSDLSYPSATEDQETLWNGQHGVTTEVVSLLSKQVVVVLALHIILSRKSASVKHINMWRRGRVRQAQERDKL